MLHKMITLLKAIYFFPLYLLFLMDRPKIMQAEFEVWTTTLQIPGNSRREKWFWSFINLLEYRQLYIKRMGGVGELIALYCFHHPICNISNISKISKGLVLQHGHSTEINAESIGENCQIWHNVTIGKDRPGGFRPSIGDNVRIMAGAIVIGHISIGDNSTIGAATVVLKDVPADCVVVGNPARIVKMKGKRVNIQL